MNTSRMNKKQKALIILPSASVLLLFIGGIHIQLWHPLNIIHYAIWITVIGILIYIVAKPLYCPKCGMRLPIMRQPQDVDQSLYGGWTCLRCKSKLDSSGNIIS